MFEPFQKFVDKAAGSYGIRTEMNAARVCRDFRLLIPEIFTNSENPQKHIDAAYYKDAILVINVENPGWAQEVIIRKEKIIEEMNNKAGRKIIKNLRTQIRNHLI